MLSSIDSVSGIWQAPTQHDNEVAYSMKEWNSLQGYDT